MGRDKRDTPPGDADVCHDGCTERSSGDTPPAGDDVCHVLPGADGLAAGVAARQRGLATADELLAGGMSRSGISRRVTAGRLTLLYRNVYLVGHPVAPPLAIELGAV